MGLQLDVCHVPLFPIPEGVSGKAIDRKCANNRSFEKFVVFERDGDLSWGAVSTHRLTLREMILLGSRIEKIIGFYIDRECECICLLEEFEIVVKIELEIF